MDDPFNPSQSNASAANAGSRSPVSSLEKGLAALQRKDYAVAIARLEAVCDDTTVDRRTQAKAQMGLVKAYERIGDIKLAMSLCQPLCDSSSQQVRTWASQTLKKLVDRYPEPELPTSAQSNSTAEATGFVPDVPISRLPEPEFPDSPHATPADSAARLSDSAQNADSSQPHRWKEAGRASKWAPLGRIHLEQLGALEIATAIALFFTVRGVVWGALSLFNAFLMRWRWIVDLREYAVFYSDPFWGVLLALLVLLGLAPWLLDGILKRFYGLQSLSVSTLATASPEASRMLKRVCSQRHYPLPTLGVLPTAVPVAMTYGSLPRTARIVVSQGLLTQLSDSEIAAIYAGELGHLALWDFAPITLVTLVAQLPYLMYWQAAVWGDRQSNAVLQGVAAAISAVGYGVYWLFHATGLWLSRARLYYSDRFACDITGNPNGLTRALLKLTIGIADEIQQQGYTSPLLESFDLLMPVGHRTALSLGSVSRHHSLTNVLSWDQSNPSRVWLALNNAHPLMGDRLHLLDRYAHHWRLESELALRTLPSSPRPKPTRSLWLQGAPFFGGLVGLAIAAILWLIGAVAGWFGESSLSWLWGDRTILWGCLLMGFSFGTFLRINAFFPDIRAKNVLVDPSVAELLNEPAMLPVHSQPVRLHGKLLGRRGIQNWLVQDLMLQTATGTIKLHYFSSMGALGNLLLHPLRPDLWVNQAVTVTGWFRRGATPWIDVETIQPQRGSILRTGHPLWSTLIASSAALWAAYIIARGNF